MKITWNQSRSLVLAWGLAGLVVGVAHAVVTVWWNDTLRDPQTILVLAAWSAGLLAVFSILAGFGSVLLGVLIMLCRRQWGTVDTSADTRLGVSSYALELCYASMAWAMFGLGLWLLESDPITGGPTYKYVTLVLGMAAAAAVRSVDGRIVPVKLLRSLPVVAAAMTVVVLAAVMQGAWSRFDSSESVTVTQEVRELGVNFERKVLFIGLDGADWRNIDALIAKGQMPVMKKLVERGVRSNLQTFRPTLSPIIWNTIATGMREDEHGIHGFTEVWLPGAARSIQGIDDHRRAPWLVARTGAWLQKHGLLQTRPVTSSHRRALAVWNILSGLNLRVGVVNWFASWPSDQVNGYFVSDNNPWRAAFNDRRVGKQTSSVMGVTWPPGLLDELSKLDLPNLGESAEDVLGLGIFDDLAPGERQELAARQQGLLKVVRSIYLSDAFVIEAGLDLMRREQLNFLAIYLSGIDNFSHRLGQMTGVVERYYRELDVAIGRYLALAGEDATIVVASDHGWEYLDEKKRGHDHAPDGVLLMAGNGVHKGVRLSKSPSILDVTPTLLSLFGLPGSMEMEGRAVTRILDEEITASIPNATVDRYGSYHGNVESMDDAQQLERNEETLRKLRALGYIQ